MAKTSSRPKANSKTFDVVVCGGGLAGLTLTAFLASRDISVLCLDRESVPASTQNNFDVRTTAISYGSHLVMKEAGVWDLIEKDCCPILDIQIKDSEVGLHWEHGAALKSEPVLLNLGARETGTEAFGWVIENRLLRLALLKRLQVLQSATHRPETEVTGFDVTDDAASVYTSGGTYTATLVVGADGRQSAVRDFLNITIHGWAYQQTAMVCTITHENPHNNIAVEHFRPEGPLAIVPMCDDAKGKHRSTVIWTEHPRANSIQHSDDDLFELALNARLPTFYGRAKLAGKRSSYPLSLQHAHEYTGKRMALVAEAAHAMHPIAGQGLNLSLRDIAALGALITEAHEAGDDIGSDALLTRYQRQRHFDTSLMMGTVDCLNKVFSTSFPPVVAARTLGLRLIKRMSRLKNILLKQAMGTAGLVPDIMKSRKS